MRWYGPLTWKDLDRKDTSHSLYNPQHDEVIYWRAKVTPLIRKRLAIELGDADLGSSCEGLPANTMPRDLSVERWKMKPGMYQGKAALDARLVQAFQKTGFKVNVIVSRLHSGGDKMTSASNTLLHSLEDYGKAPQWDNIGELFDELHGKESWQKHLQEIRP